MRSFLRSFVVFGFALLCSRFCFCNALKFSTSIHPSIYPFSILSCFVTYNMYIHYICTCVPFCVWHPQALKKHKHTISIHSNADIKAQSILCELHIHHIFNVIPSMYQYIMESKVYKRYLVLYKQGINIKHVHDYNRISRTYHHHQQIAQNLVLQYFSLFLFLQAHSFSSVVAVVDCAVAVDNVTHLTICVRSLSPSYLNNFALKMNFYYHSVIRWHTHHILC